MSDLTEMCDELKDRVRRLEQELNVANDSNRSIQERLKETAEDLRKNCSTKMELIRLFGDTADHLRVTKEGTNSEVAHRIWAKVNELRKGNSEFLLEVAQATGADTTGTNHNIADSILVQFSKLKEGLESRDKKMTEQWRELQECKGLKKEVDALKETYDVDGIPALNTYIEHQLGAVTELKEHIDVLKADHDAAIEGREKEITELQRQVDKYEHQKDTLFEDRQQCWNALRSIGGLLGVNQNGPVEPFKERILSAILQLQKMARDADKRVQDTAEELNRLRMPLNRKIGELQGDISRYEMEVSCLRDMQSRAEKKRTEDLLAANKEIVRLEDMTREQEERLAEFKRMPLNQKVQQLQEAYTTASNRETRLIRILDELGGLILMKVGYNYDNLPGSLKARLSELEGKLQNAQARVQDFSRENQELKKGSYGVPDEIMRKLWVTIQNLDATGASMAGEGGEWSTETGKAVALIGRIAEIAYKGQNITAACKHLKELL